MTFNPRQEALALRIYSHCDPLGWDCTHGDVDEALGVCRSKDWSHRLRVTRRDYDVR